MDNFNYFFILMTFTFLFKFITACSSSCVDYYYRHNKKRCYCTKCISGYYLNSKKCYQCKSPCYTCSSSTSCKSCISE